MAVLQDALNQNTAAIDDDRRLHTQTIAIDEATRVSLDVGEYFLVCNGGGTSGGGTHPSVLTSGYQLWIKNTSTTQKCLIQSVSFSSSVNGYWHIGKGGTLSSADYTAPVVNLNLSSSKTAPVEAWRGYTTAISFSSNPSRFLGGYISAYTKWVENFNGALILGTNNSIGVAWNGSALVAIGIQFFMKNK